MRSDQIEKLQLLSESLTEVVLVEADPSRWPAAKVPMNQLTNTRQRARYLAKKNANATMTVLCKVHNLLDTIKRRGIITPDDDNGDLDREIHEAEKQAAKILGDIEAKKTVATIDRFDRFMEGRRK